MSSEPIVLVHWAVQTPRRQQELEETWVELSGGAWLEGEHGYAHFPWGDRAIALASINTNHVVSLVDSDGVLVRERIDPESERWQQALLEAHVMVALIDTGRRQPYVGGFAPYAQRARALLRDLGREESLPILFAFDRRHHPDVGDEDIALLETMNDWPQCDHVPVDRGHEGLVLDRALALAQANLH